MRFRKSHKQIKADFLLHRGECRVSPFMSAEADVFSSFSKSTHIREGFTNK